ncbi:hypothetical protein [Kitasatospora sp. NPDC090308]|uniref:hypothetical protein n=1 Tax=Kitasatospora sp. NPDC090308 TaxID=3364082 RepID=UPI0037F658B1
MGTADEASTVPSQHRAEGSADGRLSITEVLIDLPFPRQEESSGRPGFHLAVLRENRDFWDDRSEETTEAAEQGLESDLAVPAATLTGRWGRPTSVDLWPYLGLDRPDLDCTAPEPLSFLSGAAGSMQVRRLPVADRWLASTIGQADPEFPFQLRAQSRRVDQSGGGVRRDRARGLWLEEQVHLSHF